MSDLFPYLPYPPAVRRLSRTLCERHQEQVRGLEGDALDRFVDESWPLYASDVIALLRELRDVSAETGESADHIVRGPLI